MLISGGENKDGALSAVELYDPAAGEWVAVRAMQTPRTQHSAILLSTGAVLVVGGVGAAKRELASAEIFELARTSYRAPRLRAPQGVTALTERPGDQAVAVYYRSPEVDANSKITSFACLPAPGAQFPVGTTEVTCTATDEHGMTASARFPVSVWDVCLRDDATGDTLLVNTRTGDYQFRRCGVNGLTVSGRARISKGECATTLQDERITASFRTKVFNPCSQTPEQLNTGEATIRLNRNEPPLLLKDGDITNNKGICA